jgi:hypothetical protein
MVRQGVRQDRQAENIERRIRARVECEARYLRAKPVNGMGHQRPPAQRDEGFSPADAPPLTASQNDSHRTINVGCHAGCSMAQPHLRLLH